MFLTFKKQKKQKAKAKKQKKLDPIKNESILMKAFNAN